MIQCKSVRNFDRISVALILASVLILAASMWVARPTSAAIPDRWLDRIRGSNPMVRRVFDDNCTDENVDNLNTFSPPLVAVSYSNCAAGLIPGVIRISCATGNNYDEQQGGGTTTQVDTTKKSFAVDRGADDGGTQGACALDAKGNAYCANNINPYSCGIYGINYPLQ